ncbi:T9SS sorting signal type C domain-containing protein [Flavobacterium sp. GN10]|uniref:T9SS sorting signal type C domain-containing protein n=1 Tax=Flavobacterium tagetis TaxID=2801336 RepID=A0ABS1KB30_9FLAO|nr:T9SS sorting signal type C domain-containing protein [Flavobacterium tagetis]MBL0736422.1 T9SS sorting signal type C domain-containing protein [Flavobacterium tagetis]
MKKDLLTTLIFFSFSTLVTYIEKPLKESRKLKILLVLVLSIFYTSFLEAQTRTHTFTANGTLLLPAGMDAVTVEGWGAGGAGGGAQVTPLIGRSGGGGGGGAYARGTINTTIVSSLNVFVGGTTTGGAGNGAAGGATYINGFTGVFNAPGGQGGNGNTTTTSNPTGGNGGTGAIGNLATAAGANGTPGSNALLSALLSSGGGGNGANFGSGGGAGGAAYNSVVLTDRVGNNGATNGGGGGGAMSSNNPMNGGSGARGQATITYTCKTYSFTGISAPNICTGTTTKVQLTGTAASLPAGTYTVTYNTSLPNAVGQTAPMLITNAGSGSFTASGLNSLGNSTITVTALTSADCTSSISAPNTANIIVSAPPTIALGTATSVCTSTSLQNVSLPYTGTTNSPTNYSITWNASPANNFLPVTNATLPTSPISIAVPAGTAAGTYTGSIAVSNAAGCVSTAPTNFTITVNPLPTITLGATTAVCSSSNVQSTTLPYTAVTNSPANYSITWNSSPTNTFAPVSNAALPASPINISIPANTAAGTYTGTLTVSNANGCVSTANNFTVTVNPLPTIALNGTTPVCFNVGAQTANLNYTATTNSPTTYSITWNASPTNSFQPVSNVTLTTSPISIAVPAGTAVGTYTGTLTVRNANGCVSTASNFTVTVNPLPTITLGATTAVCTSSIAQSTTLPYTATTNSPTNYSITWNASPTNTFAPVSNAALPASPITIPIPANTAAGTYTGTLTVSNGNGCVSTASNFTVTVNPLPTITLGATTAVCTSSIPQSTILPYTATTNSPTNYSITWNASPTNTFLPVSNAALPASPITIPIPANTAAGTYTGTLTVSNANGCVSTASDFTVTVNPLPTITLGATTAVCTSSIAQSTTLPYTATTNSPTNYSIAWNTSPTNTFAPVSNAALPASPITIPIPANTAAGTYTGTLTVSNANGCVSTASNFTVTVNPLPTITLGATTAVCTNSIAQSTTLPYTAVANSPTNYSITWNASPTNTFLPVSNAALPASPITIPIPANTAAGTYTGTLTVTNANGCISTANNFTITVNSVPTITTSGNLIPVCQSISSQTTSLPYSATTGSPISYSVDWATLNDQATTNFSFDSGGGNIDNINVPAGTAAGTYIGIMTISTSNGCLTTQAISLTINVLPTINTAGAFASVCQSASEQTTTLAYNATTGSPTSYAIDWIALTDQGATPFPFSSGSGDVINVIVPANTASGTYNGIMTITTSNGCSATQSVSLVVNPVSVAPTASVTQQPTCVNNTGVITVTSPASGTGYTYSVDGVDFSNTSGIFTGLSSGLYNVQVKNTTTGCESEATPITINVSITKVWNGNSDANWGNGANWTPVGVPSATDCVDIPNVGVDPIISGTDASFFASRLTIENNGSLIVEETNSLTVTNEVSVLGNGVLIFENNSSLVQTADVDNVGNITYRRRTSVRRFDLTYWSSPVAGVTMKDFSPETLFDKYSYWSSDFKWATNLYGTMEMEPGVGYSIRGPQSFATGTPSVFPGEFIGVPNNGTIQGPTAAAEKFCFFGNPYPSAIYADLFIRDNAANFYGTLFFWTHNTLPRITVPGTNTYRYTSDDYAIYNLSGDTSVGNLTGTGAPSPGNQTPPKGYIAAGQAFFAKARTGQRGVFTNSMRVPSNNSQFYKSTLVVEKHRVWLNLTNKEGAFKQLLIGYITGATNSFDFNYDAVTLNGNPYVDFYSINEGNKLVIQGRAVPFVVTDTIPLGYKSTIEKGEFTIAIDHTDGDLSNRDIYLQDKVTNTLHNLKSGGYTFTSAPGTFLDRFVLRYKNLNEDKSLGNEDFENQNQKIYVSVKDKNIKLQSVSEQENLQEVAIYDVGGKLLYNKKQIGSSEWLIPNFQSGPQVLLVKITLENGQKVTRKIVFR